MEKLQIVRRERCYPTEYPEVSNITNMVMNRQAGEVILSEIFDKDRDRIICFTPVRREEHQLDEYLYEFRIELEKEYVREIPVFLAKFPTYHGKEIPPPSKLTFVERVKFILTGKYPKY